MDTTPRDNIDVRPVVLISPAVADTVDTKNLGVYFCLRRKYNQLIICSTILLRSTVLIVQFDFQNARTLSQTTCLLM